MTWCWIAHYLAIGWYLINTSWIKWVKGYDVERPETLNNLRIISLIIWTSAPSQCISNDHLILTKWSNGTLGHFKISSWGSNTLISVSIPLPLINNLLSLLSCLPSSHSPWFHPWCFNSNCSFGKKREVAGNLIWNVVMGCQHTWKLQSFAKYLCMKDEESTCFDIMNATITQVYSMVSHYWVHNFRMRASTYAWTVMLPPFVVKLQSHAKVLILKYTKYLNRLWGICYTFSVIHQKIWESHFDLIVSKLEL